jgi:2-polyprenyl-6-methoxyphenol hydroxylase-like FAD-dependent oxidoreductase
VVVGADGRHSRVARAVQPRQYHERPRLLGGYYAYWSGLGMDSRFETYVRANKGDIEGNFLKMLELAPSFAERVAAAKRETRFVGTAVPNYFRKPFGPGWALVGDAGYNRDFITAQGMHDAFRDAELLATALDETFSGARPFAAAMSDYQATRDTHASWRRWSPHQRSCSSCWWASAATRKPWTPSPGSTPASSHQPSSSATDQRGSGGRSGSTSGSSKAPTRLRIST